MFKKSSLLKLLNIWPPYLGAGVRIKTMAVDFRFIEVEMKLRFWNRNYVGTQFGGSMYSMVDPFFMLMLMENLGRDYIVWDKAATIRFKKPGTGRVVAKFYLSKEQLEEYRQQADQNYKIEPILRVDITNDAGEIIAEVDKTLYIRRKDKVRQTDTNLKG